MDYQKVTRRIFLGLGASVAAIFVAAGGGLAWFLRSECKGNHAVKNNPVPDDHFDTVFSTRRNPPDIYNLDVVTVGPTSAIITWASAESLQFEIGQDGGAESASGEGAILWQEQAPAKFHSAELTALAPDADHSLRLAAKGGGLERDIAFRTLPDAGEVLFTFAAFSDNHFKPDGMSWPDGRLFRRCREAHECLVRDINAASPDFIINKGDLTDVYDQYRLRAYREAVAGLKPPVHSIPGNHDHLRNDDFMRDWRDFAGTDLIYRSFDHKGIHFILLDTCWTGEQKRGRLGKEQLAWLTKDLDKNRDKSSLIFTHHPVNGELEESRVAHDHVEFQKIIAMFPRVEAVFSAHVHRNYVTTSELTPGIPYIETAAVIQYPMGYNIYEVTRTGIRQAFRKLSDTSLSEESWLASPLRCLTNPGDALGRMEDRNFFLKFRRSPNS